MAGRKVSEVLVEPLGDHEFEVRVSDGDVETTHRVIVPDGFMDQFDDPDLDEETVVEESFAFLLERESATSIMQEFSLTVISGYFPEYTDALRRLLT